MFESKQIDYYDGEVLLEGYCAFPEKHTQNALVMVFHDWTGRSHLACDKAEQLAKLGYIGFAVDMYGKGRLGKTKEEKTALMQPLVQDRYLLKKRALAAFDAAKKIAGTDDNRIAAIGFCFGGLCALDLARSGADIKAIVSFHGLLNGPETLEKEEIKAKILVLHGFDDPMVTRDQVLAFCDEMTAARVDWELDIYGGTMHAFTNPEANDPGFGTVYQPQSAERAWAAMTYFLKQNL